MSREIDWHVLDKAADITASAVRGAMGSEGSQPASYVGDVFREIDDALRKATDEMPSKIRSRGSEAVRVEPIRAAVLAWYRPRRRAYAWRRCRRSPYRTLVSEVMLQQTQAARVEPLFLAFLDRFPDVASLAAASRPTCSARGPASGITGGPSPSTRPRGRSWRIIAGGSPRRRRAAPVARRRAVHGRRGRVDRPRRAGGRGRHERPPGLRPGDPRGRAGRGGGRGPRGRRRGGGSTTPIPARGTRR